MFDDGGNEQFDNSFISALVVAIIIVTILMLLDVHCLPPTY